METLKGMGLVQKVIFIIGKAVFEMVVGQVRLHSYRDNRLTTQVKISSNKKLL